jgi:hypothetical protein
MSGADRKITEFDVGVALKKVPSYNGNDDEAIMLQMAKEFGFTLKVL